MIILATVILIFIDGVISAWKYFPVLLLSSTDIFYISLCFVGAILGILLVNKYKYIQTFIGVFVSSLILTIIFSNFIFKNKVLDGSLSAADNFSLGLILLYLLIVFVLFFKLPRKILVLFAFGYVLAGVTVHLIDGYAKNYGRMNVVSGDLTLSKNKKNVIVIVVDTARSDVFGNSLVNAKIDGLTLYGKYFSNFTSTFTSVPYFLSGIDPLGKSYSDYQLEFECDNIQSKLLDKNWSVSNYPYDYLKDTLPLKPCNTTVITEKESSGESSILKKIFVGFAAYAYMQNFPNVLFSANPLQDEINNKSQSDETKIQILTKSKVEFTDKNIFAFIHLNGLHQPIVKASPTSTIVEDYTLFSDKIALEIAKIVKILKSKGISDQTTLIVMGDHGRRLEKKVYEDIKNSDPNQTLNFVLNESVSKNNYFKKIFGEEIEFGYFLSLLDKSGIDNTTFLKYISPYKINKVDKGSIVIDLSRAAFATVEFDKNGVEINKNLEFSNLLSKIVSKKTGIGFFKQNNKINLTVFSGNITNEPVGSSVECTVDNDFYRCNHNDAADIYFSNQEDGNYVLTVLKPYNNRCLTGVQEGTNFVTKDKLICLNGYQSNSFKLRKFDIFDNHEFSQLDVDTTGIKNILGYKSRVVDTSPPSHSTTTLQLTSSGMNAHLNSYQFNTCLGSYTINLYGGIIFEINHINMPNKKCNYIDIFNTNPFVPYISANDPKDTRFISSQYNRSFLNLNDLNFDGIRYPKEGKLQWIAAFPFAFDKNICLSSKKLMLYPSQTGDVTVQYYKNNLVVHQKQVNKDELINLSDLCIDDSFDIIKFNASKFIVYPGDKRVYVSQLWD